VGRRTGRAELDEHAEGIHNSELDVDLVHSARPKEEVYAEIRSRLAVLPVSINIGQPIEHRLEHMLSGVRAQIALKLFGGDLDTLRRLAETLRVPLRLLGDVEEADGPNQIQRENGQRRIAVTANSDGRRDMASIVADIRSVVSEASLPQGYTTRLEGTFQAQEEAARLIALLSLLSLGLIFIVLYSRYQSTVLAFIIMANIPLALIGSVVALYIAGQPLSVASMIGFITLAGISARNGILKVSHYINLVLHEGERFDRDLVVRGSLERLTPVLMTALSAGLALIPLLFGAGEAGREILHPVAVTIFGGLLSSTVLDTLLTPLLFLAFGRRPLERLVERESTTNLGVAGAY
jgi:HME family heavy-metal exporter